ncbi:unnamed protein product [Vitrella brassicaformis CCMP3155]|uniref:Inner membrane component domain-containing protein n=2 Tax=Vitrella brassicaformis TaxID=1169539 RepID=A0A0G4H1V4_VITBC|nr:unnamed protein product [Vitrella brassicaformis CCMP3155]|eukprot:CEM37381.1 unnamed protein product [Vitrella brassicaformis CCMP3155]
MEPAARSPPVDVESGQHSPAPSAPRTKEGRRKPSRRHPGGRRATSVARRGSKRGSVRRVARRPLRFVIQHLDYDFTHQCGCRPRQCRQVWIMVGGFLPASVWIIAAMILHLSIIGRENGQKCFAMATISLRPFGVQIEYHSVVVPPDMCGTLVFYSTAVIKGIFGCLVAAIHLLLALLWLITIVGIPFPSTHLKLAFLVVWPFDISVSLVEDDSEYVDLTDEDEEQETDNDLEAGGRKQRGGGRGGGGRYGAATGS